MQLTRTVHKRLNPKLVPDFDIDVTLPVPTLYAMIKIPGIMLSMKVLILFFAFRACYYNSHEACMKVFHI